MVDMSKKLLQHLDGFPVIMHDPAGRRDVFVNWRKVESSNVEMVGWDTEGTTLFVQFRGGSRYAYPGVSRQKAVAVAYAESVGAAVNKRIKPHHEAIRIR